MRLLTFLLSIIILTSSVFAQNDRREHDGFGIFANWGHSLANDKGIGENIDHIKQFDYPTYWYVNLGVDYKYTFHKTFYVKPALSFYYSRHDSNSQENAPDSFWLGCPPPYIRDLKSYEFGGNIAAMIGVTKYFGSFGLELETGPFSKIKFDSKMKGVAEHCQKYIEKYSKPNPYKDFLLYWRLGININFWKLQAKISYDIATMNYYHNLRASDQISVGMGYRF